MLSAAFRYVILAGWFVASLPAFQSPTPTVLARLGHFQHGDAFHTGPRQKPWLMTGIGEAHFPITTKNPEVQRWFDQGNGLPHSFGDYDAERAFRWCLKLEPGNAIAYWGLARASMLRGLGGDNRPAEMIREAAKRKDQVTERERLYIEALSARRYGEVVPGIGHALHMPGQIFSIVGMWNEAAISMDAARRAEKKYMVDQLTFPFNNWNYGHNLNYLSYIQEQLGMANAASAGSRQLIDAPLDPQTNNDEFRSSHSYGIQELSRGLLKFERGDELLDDKTIPWRDIFMDKVNKAYFRARAYFAKGDIEKAQKALETGAGVE